MRRIILASASPRRRELLEQIGFTFEICPAEGEERFPDGLPEDGVMALARQKALEVANRLRGTDFLEKPQEVLVIGADTVVAYRDKILGKPADVRDAAEMLALLSGKTHSVYTGVAFVLCSVSGTVFEHSFYEKTDVTMYAMSEEEIQRYIATGEPMDKAGAYGIQGKCAAYIERIAGDYNNVVGLPIGRLYQEWKKIPPLRNCTVP